jgi:hypothetical protein
MPVFPKQPGFASLPLDGTRAWEKGPTSIRIGNQLAGGPSLPPGVHSSMEPSGTCAGHLAAVLGLWKASLLQTALQETVIVDSPGLRLSPLRGALAVQAYILPPGAREAACGWQARVPSPWALLFF